jgi:Flp pilus assembly protein TadG
MSPAARRWAGGRGEQGAAAVEFAIVLPLLLVILFGIVEFGLLLYDQAMITNASREGARSGVVYRFNYGTSPGYYDPLSQSEVQDVVNAYLGTFLVTFARTPAAAVTTLRCFTDAAYGSTVSCASRDETGRDATGYWIEVQVGYAYDFLVIPDLIESLPGVGPWLRRTLQLHAVTRMRME